MAEPRQGDHVAARVSTSGGDVLISLERESPEKSGGFVLPVIGAPLAIEDSRFLQGGLATLYLYAEEGEGVPELPLRAEAAAVAVSAGRELPLDTGMSGDRGMSPADRETFFPDRRTWEPAAPPFPAAWAFWGEQARIRGRVYRALHIRLERLAPSGSGVEEWGNLTVRLETGSIADAAGLARRLHPAPPAIDATVCPPAAAALPAGPDPRAAVPGFFLRTAAAGVYAVTLADLTASGWNGNSVLTGQVSLTRHRVPIPVWFRGGEDGVLDRPEDAILFYGEPEKNAFSSTTTYWLSFAAGPGLPLESRRVRPSPAASGEGQLVVRAEEDHEYWLGLPDGVGRDHWFWNRLRAGELIGQDTFSVFVPILQSPTGLGQLHLELQGKTVGPHQLRVTVNSDGGHDILWYGAVPWSETIGLLAGNLVRGANRFDLALTGSGLDLLYLDRIEIAFEGELRLFGGALAFAGEDARPRAFTLTGVDGAGGTLTLLDVTDPFAPVALEGAEVGATTASFADSLAGRAYFAATPVGVRGPAAIRAHAPPLLLDLSGADYLVIGPRAWLEPVAPLIAAHRGRGLRVEVVTPEEAYAAFGDGEPTPTAFRSLLAYAYAAWSPVPRYVLLIGDATYDYRNLLGGAPDPVLPTLPRDTPSLGEIGSDNGIADVDGDDGIPEFAIGRIPGRTAGEIGAAVTKTVAYAQTIANPGGEGWLRRLHFIADDGGPLTPFEWSADQLASIVQPAYTIERSYLSVIGNVSSARSIIRERLDAGSLLSLYIGHGNVTTWAVERLFNVDDAGQLMNAPRTPVVVALNCLNGYFSDAEAPASLAEAFLRREGGGAVGVWAPAGLGFLEDEYALSHIWMHELFVRDQRTIGEVILTAKARLATFPGFGSNRELLEGYTWFGDPALEVGLPGPRAPARPAARATVAGVWLRWDEELSVQVWRAAAGEDSMLIGAAPAGQRNWVDSTASPGNTYRYAIQAEDAAGFVSPLSPWVEVRAGDVHGDKLPPTIVLDLPENCADGSSVLSASVSDPDGVVCDGLAVELDGVTLGASDWSASCTSGGIASEIALEIPAAWPAGPHTLRLTAMDGAGAVATFERAVVACGPLRALALHLAPNPTRELVAIDLDFNRPVRLEVDVVSAAVGRLVARFAAEPAVHHHLAWNGRDGNGRRAASGVYVMRLIARTTDGEQWETERKAVLLR